MDGERVTMAFPRPGRALKALLILIAAVGILEGVLVNYTSFGKTAFVALACIPADVMHGQVWRLLTAGLLTSPESFGHLIFMLVGLYFLSPDLERRWGGAGFLRFVAVSVIAGFALSVLVDRLAPAQLAPAALHPPLMFGASAAIASTSVAWARANAQLEVRLFFFLPISGRQLFWVTIGFCCLGLIYPQSVPEGVLTPFGGVLVGVLLGGGSPSPIRTAYLRLKLALLRRRAGVGATPLRAPSRAAAAKRRGDAPPLRVVPGGLEDELKKRRPPKDKRYLN